MRASDFFAHTVYPFERFWCRDIYILRKLSNLPDWAGSWS